MRDEVGGGKERKELDSKHGLKGEGECRCISLPLINLLFPFMRRSAERMICDDVSKTARLACSW